MGVLRCGEPPYSTDEIDDLFDELIARNKEQIDASKVYDYLPSIKDTVHSGQGAVLSEGLLEGCENFYMSNAGDGRRFLSLVSFDIEKLGRLDATTVVAKPGAIYANERSLYVAVRHYRDYMSAWYYDQNDNVTEATTLHKFELSPVLNDSIYKGSGVVKGRVLNQFAMDEMDGYLRIATTTGHVPSPDVHSTLSVLIEKKGKLSTVGMVDHIAPTEDIRSVRFNGDLGFVVTFKKTDPLFVIDLSAPTDPQIKGELKIPGFSTYMHLMDDEHLLTIGYDADDQGSFAWFTGIQLQIMDVSDIADPKLIHKEVIGSRGSTSDAATDHLAFNYYPTRDLLAIPMIVCEGGDGGSYGYEMTFNGLLVYDVTAESGFDRVGGISHGEAPAAEDYWSACGNWWTDSNSQVKRSIFMEDFVYSIAMDRINIAQLSSLDLLVSSVEL